jgi:hypothetical protein
MRYLWALRFGLVMIIVITARADSNQPPVTTKVAAGTAATPMTDTTAMAPYAVRTRITSFLARQHAQEGNQCRALTEFYSMLQVDDPAWPDDEQGDSFRIARDIEVAQMMTEAGFYDHAIRVLHTSLILGTVNQDPQVSQIRFQMEATAELARLKGVPVPEIELSFLEKEPAQFTEARELSGNKPLVAAAEGPKSETGPGLIRVEPPQLPKPVAPPNELPQKKIEPVATQPMTADSDKDETEVKEHPGSEGSAWSWLNPMRWLPRKEAAPPCTVHKSGGQRPMISPAVSPTYCQGCSGLHGGGVVVRYNPRTGITHTHEIPAAPTPATASIPGTQSKLATAAANHAKHRDQIASDSWAPRISPPTSVPQRIRRGIATETSYASAPSSRSLESGTDQPGMDQPVVTADTSPERDPWIKRTESVQPAVEVAASPPPGSHANESGPALTGPALAAPSAPAGAPQRQNLAQTQEQPGWSRAVRAVAHIGVAGDVSNPGIFAMQGRSTTLAALLRRTGEQDIMPDKKARILRAVEIRDRNSGLASKDFYCQRLDGLRMNTEAMDTPVYSHEVVIVDGAGEKPIYLAVMPHFILQLPVDRRSALTTDQIVDLLSEHWPSIRERSIGVLRYEHWGRAASMPQLAEGDPDALVALTAGDVVYIDGTSLDSSAVIAAAESVAKMAGARIRKHQ